MRKKFFLEFPLLFRLRRKAQWDLFISLSSDLRGLLFRCDDSRRKSLWRLLLDYHVLLLKRFHAALSAEAYERGSRIVAEEIEEKGRKGGK